jgi:glucan 1,3-beta-glucosidase
MALIQTETPYFQSNPDASTPFTANAAFADPIFKKGSAASNNKAWGLRIVDSDDVFIHGAGLYSFFENYGQTCVPANNCQDNMVSLENSGGIHLYGLSTKAAINQVTVNGESAALDKDNRNNFCAAIAWFEIADTNPGSTKCKT